MTKTKNSKSDPMEIQKLQNALNSCNEQISDLKMSTYEVESALSEISEERNIYKVIGNIMVSSKYSKVKKDLEEKKNLLVERMKRLEQKKEEIENELNSSSEGSQ